MFVMLCMSCVRVHVRVIIVWHTPESCQLYSWNVLAYNNSKFINKKISLSSSKVIGFYLSPKSSGVFKDLFLSDMRTLLINFFFIQKGG